MVCLALVVFCRPFEIYAHSEYAAITAQRYEEHIELAESLVRMDFGAASYDNSNSRSRCDNYG